MAVDDRLGDLARHTEQGFARIDDDLRSLNARFDALQRTMLAMMASILVGFAALIATQL